MRDAERVEQIGKLDLVEQPRHVLARDLPEGALLDLSAVGRRTKVEVVRDQGVHPVNGHKLLSDRVGHPKWSFVEPGMPLTTSLALILPRSLWTLSPATPHQLALIPICMVGWPRMAVVHSTVWIFAKSAALMSRA